MVRGEVGECVHIMVRASGATKLSKSSGLRLGCWVGRGLGEVFVEGLTVMSDPTGPSVATSGPHKRGFLCLFSIL